MMNLLIQRKWAVEDATLGELFIDDVFECYTLEDIVRPISQKVPGQTAIPAGTYKVKTDWSPRFNKNMPHILDVPGFEGVRIHAGNTAEDTEGCIIVGQTVDLKAGEVGQSRMAYEQLFRKLYDTKDVILRIREI